MPLPSHSRQPGPVLRRSIPSRRAVALPWSIRSRRGWRSLPTTGRLLAVNGDTGSVVGTDDRRQSSHGVGDHHNDRSSGDRHRVGYGGRRRRRTASLRSTVSTSTAQRFGTRSARSSRGRDDVGRRDRDRASGVADRGGSPALRSRLPAARREGSVAMVDRRSPIVGPASHRRSRFVGRVGRSVLSRSRWSIGWVCAGVADLHGGRRGRLPSTSRHAVGASPSSRRARDARSQAGNRAGCGAASGDQRDSGPGRAVDAHEPPSVWSSTRARSRSMPLQPFVTLPAVDAPASAVDTSVRGWSLVEVKRGDSIWAIAERVADGRDIAVVAEQIVTANLGNGDGRRAPLLDPGTDRAGMDAERARRHAVATPLLRRSSSRNSSCSRSTDDYVVVAGDSYWKIAEDHLDPSAAASDVAALTTRPDARQRTLARLLRSRV